MSEPLWPSAQPINNEKYNPLDDGNNSNFSMSNSCAPNLQFNASQNHGNVNFPSGPNLMTPQDYGNSMRNNFCGSRQNNCHFPAGGGMEKLSFWNENSCNSPGNFSCNKSPSGWPPVENFHNSTPRYDPVGIYQKGQSGGYNIPMNNEPGRMFSGRSSGSNPNGDLWMNVQPRSSNFF